MIYGVNARVLKDYLRIFRVYQMFLRITPVALPKKTFGFKCMASGT